MALHLSRSTAIAAALLALAASPAAAQTTTQDSAPASPAATSTDGTAPAGAARFITRQGSSQILGETIIGMAVRNGPSEDAKEIGKVTDLILDQDHKLVGIVVGVGGFLGMGRKDVGIPWSEVVRVDPEQKFAEVDMTKEQLENAPEFAEAKREGGVMGGAAPAGGAPAGADRPATTPAPSR